MKFHTYSGVNDALLRGSVICLCILMMSLSACSDLARIPVEAGYGASPTLPLPTQTLIPTVNIAPTKGWTIGDKPTTVLGTRVDAFAEGLDHPRWLYVLPNGDVLVAESNEAVKKPCFRTSPIGLAVLTD